MTRIPELEGAIAIPKDGDGPVFGAPWEARAFAIVVKMHELGHFSWPEWVEYLSAEIAAATERGDPQAGAEYYGLWLTACEKLLADKGVVPSDELSGRKAELAAPRPEGG